MGCTNMRKYKIKRGYHPNIEALIKEYFGATGDIEKGMNFEVEGIGKINIKRDNKLLIVDIEPPKNITGDYSIIKKWNKFLFEATGKNTKERKKEFGKIK
jgi:hypothetical protein